MKTEKLTTRVTKEQKNLLKVLGSGKPSVGLQEIFEKLEWIKSVLPKLSLEEKQAIFAALTSTMWTPSLNGLDLAHIIEDFVKYETETAKQFKINYLQLSSKLKDLDKLSILAIFIARDASLNDWENLQNYWR